MNIASGLGSSGLTTGPYIAYLLAQHLNADNSEWDMNHYQKEMNLYVNKKKNELKNISKQKTSCRVCYNRKDRFKNRKIIMAKISDLIINTPEKTKLKAFFISIRRDLAL